ncbi:MAG TPA: hypothetical protein VFV87_02465 [Pirellulaceae bacterium]|nr:hypothetical protein [Pirellulaceae bacterium]
MRRLQFSLGMLFVLVTLSAVGVDFYRRRELVVTAYRRNLIRGAVGEMRAAESLDSWDSRNGTPGHPTPSQRAKAAQWLAEAEYHQRLAKAYRRAAWFPWYSVDEESHTCEFDDADKP